MLLPTMTSCPVLSCELNTDVVALTYPACPYSHPQQKDLYYWPYIKIVGS